MAAKKRGSYFKYIKRNSDNIPTKIPRQTLWNRKNGQKKINVSNLEWPEEFVSFEENSIDDEEHTNIQSDLIEDNESYRESNEKINFAQQNIDAEDMRTLHASTDCSVVDALCMIYAYSIRHNLSWTATEDLIRLVNCIIGKEELTPSKHIFKRKIRRIANCDITKHFICHKCDLYLGSLGSIKDSKKQFCSNCHTRIQMDTKFKKNHFVTIPFENHLRSILEKNCDQLNFNLSTPTNDIRDVHDSIHFQNLRQRMENVPFITLTFNTDGAALFKSTKEKSVWPLQFIINEIDLEYRFKRENIFCASIAFGKTPDMRIFLRPFIEEINRINAEGGLSFTMKNRHKKTVKIIPMIFTGDVLARCYVLNKGQFNGYFGCSYCLHKGSLVNRQVRYCKRDSGPLRSNNEVRANMMEAHISNAKVKGYHGVSALFALDNFDVVWQVGIDKMHNIDLGVTKLMFKLFLSSKYRGERYYVGDRIAEIDERIQNVRLPKLLRRNLRKISEREYFHAHEWKVILLFVAYPLLKGILPERYLEHLAQLIDATHILCSTVISPEKLHEANELLCSFVDHFEILYGEQNMVFNVHLLTHLVDCVQFIGPLYAYSNYSFEDNIGHLVSLHKGTTDVAHQISEKYLMEKNLFSYLNVSPIAEKFYEEINGKHTYSFCRRANGSLLIGKAKSAFTMKEHEKSLISSALNIPNNTQIEKYEAMLLNSKIYYETSNESQGKHTNDSFVFNLESRQFATIESILLINETVYFLINEKFEAFFDGTNTCKFNIPLKERNCWQIKIINSSLIGPKYSLIVFNDKIACSKFPNLFERN